MILEDEFLPKYVGIDLKIRCIMAKSIREWYFSTRKEGRKSSL